MKASAAIAACLWQDYGRAEALKVAVRAAAKQSDEPYEVTINRRNQVTICCKLDMTGRGVNLWPKFGGLELLEGIPFDDWQPKYPPDAVTWLGKIDA